MPTSAASAVYVAADRLGELADVAGADVAGARRQRHDERQVSGLNPFGEQADLGVSEQQRRQRAIGDDGRGRHRRRLACSGRSRAAAAPTARPTAGPSATFGGRSPITPATAPATVPTATGPAPVNRPASPTQRRGQGAAGQDPMRQSRDLPGTLPRPGHRFRARQDGRPSERADALSRFGSPTRRQTGTSHRPDDTSEGNCPRRRFSWVGRHPRKLPSSHGVPRATARRWVSR